MMAIHKIEICSSVARFFHEVAPASLRHAVHDSNLVDSFLKAIVSSNPSPQLEHSLQNFATAMCISTVNEREADITAQLVHGLAAHASNVTCVK